MGQVCFKRGSNEFCGDPGLPQPKAMEGPGSVKAPVTKNARLVMGKYLMHMSEDDIMGEGTSSVCRRGTIQETGETVAIKVYKVKPHKSKEAMQKEAQVTLQKFKRQIEVLLELQKPFDPPEDDSLWNEMLASAAPAKLFMRIIDYSKDKDGNPGPSADDNVLYVITEMAQYSLKDYIKTRREEKSPFSTESVRNISKVLILVTAGLHAKGLVHLDLKPENLMLFNGRLKLIDVDGCVRIGTRVSITDSSLSFSPCYCAPEWAKFLIEDVDDPHITVTPALDVWSIGMTISELVILDAALKPTYASFMRNGRSHREAGFYFMDWLSSLKSSPIHKDIEKFDKHLVQLLVDCLLVCDPKARKSLAESLSHHYIRGAKLSKSKSIPLTKELEDDDEPVHGLPKTAARHKRQRVEDHSDAIVHKGNLWKLDTDGDPMNPEKWRLRDMWIAQNGSMCYFSKKEDKRLVLLDAHHLSTATVSRFEKGAKNPAFMITTKPDHDDHEHDEHDEYYFACETEDEFHTWVASYEKVKHEVVRSMELGENFADDLRSFRVTVKNRRQKVEHESHEQFEPVFKARLWKVKAGGDIMKESDWFERDMWLSKNGSLVYFSKKEDKELVYYTHSDLAGASVVTLGNDQSSKPWTFQVHLRESDGMTFAPGEFAAESEEMRDKWVAEFKRFSEI